MTFTFISQRINLPHGRRRRRPNIYKNNGLCVADCSIYICHVSYRLSAYRSHIIMYSYTSPSSIIISIIICREPSMHTNKAVVSSGLGAGTRAAHSGQIAAPGPRMDGYADAQAADPPTVRGLKAGSGAQ